ncbi:MAG: NUDIX domain-containing protein [Candidatus Chromulinivorax sp.]|nr:NUDIX domain-containing protein [Candidatus Chromulinivorax sp.]
MSTERFQMTAFVGIIVRQGDQILLMKRSQSTTNGGKYACAGGGVDGGETIAAAAIRESQEELGITIAEQDLKFVHVIHVKTERNTELIVFFYETTQWTGNPSIMEPDKCDELIWVDEHQLPTLMLATHKQVLAMIKKNIMISDIGL